MKIVRASTPAEAVEAWITAEVGTGIEFNGVVNVKTKALVLLSERAHLERCLRH